MCAQAIVFLNCTQVTEKHVSVSYKRNRELNLNQKRRLNRETEEKGWGKLVLQGKTGIQKDVTGKKLKMWQKQMNCENSTSFSSPLVSPFSFSHFVFLIFFSFCSVIFNSVPHFTAFFSPHISVLCTFCLKKKVLWMHLHGLLSLSLSVS